LREGGFHRKGEKTSRSRGSDLFEKKNGGEGELTTGRPGCRKPWERRSPNHLNLKTAEGGGKGWLEQEDRLFVRQHKRHR